MVCCFFSLQVLLDGNVTSLAQGSPSFQQWDTSAVVTLRMPLPVTSAVYSTLLRLGGDSTAHLIKERLIHKLYAHDDHVTSQGPPAEFTTKTEDSGEKEKEEKKGKDSNKNVKVANPEYKHVRDSSSADAAISASVHLPLLSALVVLGLVSRVVFRELSI